MKQIHVTPPLYEYLLEKSLREHPVLKALREDTAHLELAVMQISPDQAQFMQFLLRILNAKKVLELGTFTGYSALSMALSLPDDAQVITCDISKPWTDRARKFWRAAEQEHKIQLRLAPALDTLHELLHEGLAEQFDFIFIDADKTNYLNYYEMALKLIQPKGVIALDNVLWDGAVIDPNDETGQTKEIRKLNDFIQQDQRVNVSLIALADGLFLVQPT